MYKQKQKRNFISGRELGFINTIARSQGPRTEEARDKDALRQKSKERYSTWTNTLEAHRRIQDAQKTIRLEQIEAQQQFIDEQERDYHIACNQGHIDRANRLLYQGQDRVKELHSGLLLAHVLKERDNQIVLKERKAEVLKQREQERWREEKEAMKSAEEWEAMENRAARLKANRINQQQKAQIEALRVEKEKERHEALREGEHARHLANLALREHMLHEKKKEMIAKETTNRAKAFNQLQMEEKKGRFALEAKEEEKLALERAQVEERNAMRIKVAADRRKEQELRHASMLQKQHDNLTELQAAHAAKMHRDVVAKQQSDDAKHTAMVEKRAGMLEEMKKSRALQVARKQKAKLEEKEDDRLRMEALKAQLKAVDHDQAYMKAVMKRNDLNLQASVREQMAAAQAKRANEKAEQLAEDERVRLAMKEEDENFKAYSASVIAGAATQLLSTKPLEIILNKPDNLQKLFPHISEY